MFRTPYSSLKGSMYDSLKSNRDMNIPLNAAVGELIDNSFEWNSKNVRIIYESAKAYDVEKPARIIVIDDGLGMKPEKLADHLTVGFHEPFGGKDSKITVSKYGVGSKYAFFNVCTKSEVWSKEKGGVWYKAEFDLDDTFLKKGFVTWVEEYQKGKTTGYPRDAVQQNPPDEFKEIWEKLKSGTIVLWSNFDRAELPEGTDELTWWIARTYRNFIGEKIIKLGKNKQNEPVSIIGENENIRNIFFNDIKIESYDPLYRIPYREKDTPCKDPALDYPPLVIPYPIDDTEWREKIGSPSANIIVHFGISPPEWRSEINESAESSINMKERRIQGGGTRHGGYRFWDSRCVSIIRNNREVGWIQDGWLVGRVEDIDRWWGMTIEFGRELDQAFQVRNVKYEVKPTGELRSKIREEIKSTILSLRKEISDHFEKVNIEKIKEKEKKGELEPTVSSSPTQEVIDENPGILGEVEDTEESPEDMVDRIFKDLPEHIRRSIIDDSARRKLTIRPNLEKRVPEDTNLMFEFTSKGSNILMVRYDNHPYYKKLNEKYEKLKEEEGILEELLLNEDNGNNKNILNALTNIKIVLSELETIRDFGINSLVIALARLQPTGEQRRMFIQFLSEWSRLNMSLIAEKFKEET
jgi:hypothetical protein